MSPFYPPGSENDETVEDQPHFSGPDEVAQHQAENLRRALGEELWRWLEEMTSPTGAPRPTIRGIRAKGVQEAMSLPMVLPDPESSGVTGSA